MIRRATMVLAFAVCSAAPLAAQNSGYGILGVGFPSRPTSVQARALGDGPAAADPQSGLNPAALGLVNQLSVSASAAQEFRELTLGGVQTTGLHQARFPYTVMTGRLGRSRLAYSLGFFGYAERTFDLSKTDTLPLRGSPVVVSDQTGSAGAVVDGRGALAWSVSPKLSIGGALHVIGGSARLTVKRSFSDSVYRPYIEESEAAFSGVGGSIGVLVVPTSKIRLGLSTRVNSKLQRSVADVRGADLPLPASLTAGFDVRPNAGLRLTAGTTWRSWSSAGSGVGAGTHAFDTFEAGGGIEVGGGARTKPKFPIRLGLRYATLPFSPTPEQPHELNLSGGTRVRFAQDKVHFDFTLERAIRDGGGASERAWALNVGFEIRP